ncbi:MAG: Cof-type HAD-IIB family hydrolase [Eubacteriales bacterium]|nr:Cof-type HAD-IIB family hydrolase [Eubacteriales bacterium]
MKLVASDLDGTMMRPDCTISDYSKNTVRKFMEQGNVFVPTTGRCYRSAAAQIGDVEKIRYFNTSNGCLVYDRKEDKVLLNHVIPSELAYEIYRDAKELGGAVEIYSELDSYLEEEMFPLALTAFNKELSENLYATTLTTEPPEEKIRSGKMRVNKYNLVFKTVEDKEKIAEKYGVRDDVVVTIPTIYNLEVFYGGCDKDTAIRMIEELEGISHEDTVAIGDSINDMAMVKYAALGAAVANAMEPLKEIADQIILSNGEDGPAKLIEKIME